MRPFVVIVSLIAGIVVSGIARAAPVDPARRFDAVSYDTRGRTAAELAAWQALVRDGFWLETGDALLVAAPAAVHAALAARGDAVVRHGALSLDELVLVPIGCSDAHGHDHDTVMPVPLAVIGRHALLAVPSRAARTWQDALPVAANSALAREYRGGAARGGTDPVLASAADAVDTARWFTRVEALAQFDRSTYGTIDPLDPDYPTQIGAARDWLRAQFEAMGLATSYQDFNIDIPPSPTPAQRQNVIAVLPGLARPNEWVLVGAHYDSRKPCNTATGCGDPAPDTPGAEDNASGCAGVLEMASIFTTLRPDRTVIFMCYAGEEQGLRGSNTHAASLQASGDIAKLKLVVVMDMIGFSGDVDYDFLLESRPEQAALLNEFATLAATYAPGSRTVMGTSPCCSDHVGYLNRGAPGLLTIENDWSPTFSPGYTHYHQTTDIPANMTNAQAMAGRILRTNAAAIARYALLTPRVFADGFE